MFYLYVCLLLSKHILLFIYLRLYFHQRLCSPEARECTAARERKVLPLNLKEVTQRDFPRDVFISTLPCSTWTEALPPQEGAQMRVCWSLTDYTGFLLFLFLNMHSCLRSKCQCDQVRVSFRVLYQCLVPVVQFLGSCGWSLFAQLWVRRKHRTISR